jgi:predicted HAD superfamily hydrolase
MTADAAAPAWMWDESLRKLETRLAPSSTSLPRVVSFDFFDTLVLRLCKDPTDLFVELGRQLARMGLLRMPLTPSEFRSVRISAEEKARQKVARAGRCPEIGLGAIYAEMGEIVSDLAEARDAEFALEQELWVLNPAVASLIEHTHRLGCRTAIVSDTYFSSIDLLGFLEARGLSPSLVDTVFASCEQGTAKWHNGGLFHAVLKRFDLHPGELLHIGDNLKTDVAQARRLGIDALHYYRTTAALDYIFNGEKRLAGQGEMPAGSLEAIRILAARQAEGDDDAFRDGALVLGPVLARFADWCVDHYARAGVTRVLALMREGDLLGELVKRSAAIAGVPLEIVTCYASRMSTARAAMSAVNVESAAALLEGSEQLAPQAILDILGLTREGEGFLDPESRKRPLPSKEASLRFLNTLFQLPMLRQVIEARHRESHQLAFEYFSAQVGGEAKIGILDLGWSGSIQRNIANILRNGARPVKTIGCYLACTRRAARLTLEGDEVHAYLGRTWNRSAILPEVCVNACIGSTIGYARDADGKAQPVLGAYTAPPEQVAIKQRLRAGIMAFQAIWLEQKRWNGHAWSPDFLADIDQASHSILFRWMDYPTKPEADRLGVLHHDENYFGSMNDAALCDERSRARFRRSGAQALFLDASCYWPQGIMAQVNPRLLSVLRNGFDDAMAIGFIGSLAGVNQEDGGLTLDETISLGHLLRHFGPSQVVVAGLVTPATLAALKTLDVDERSAAPTVHPRLILGGDVEQAWPDGEARVDGVVRVRGKLDDASTHGAIRAWLRPGSTAALVVTGDVTEGEARAVLNGLAPFLGPKATILLSAGRHDRVNVEAHGQKLGTSDNPVERGVKSWFQSSSADLGFGLWDGDMAQRAHMRNWIVLSHAPENMFWSGQWMPVVTDLGYRPAADDDRVETHAASGEHPVHGAKPARVEESEHLPFTAVPTAASDR